MPGFSLQYDPTRPADHATREFATALVIASHTATYVQRVSNVGPHCLLGWSAYPEYPIRMMEMPGAVLLLDGAIYDPSDAALFAHAQQLDDAPDRCAQMATWLRGWLPGCDAECVIVYVERRADGGAIIANDSLGRLPVYWVTEGGRTLIAREIKMITPFLRKVEGDRQGIAESLHFGYPLGSRTLLNKIMRFNPGTIMELGHGKPPNAAAYHTWSFDTERTTARPRAVDAERLADTFVKTCVARTAPFSRRRKLLLLSGGLDSRAVAGGLAKSGCSFDTLTCTNGRDDGHDPECVNGARVASHLRASHQLLESHNPTPTDRQWIIELRDGLNSAAMAEGRRLYEAVRARWGDSTVVFTGDGGDKVMPCLHPFKRVSTIRSLVAMVTGSALVFDRRTACMMAGLSQSEFERGIREVVESYPERDLADRYIHFVIFERGFKWLFEGEDRVRSQFWEATPFYGQSFFEQAMKVPQKWKKSRRWYRAFLSALSPELVLIPDANTGRPPGTTIDTGREWAKRIVKFSPSVETFARRMRRRLVGRNLDEPVRWLPEPLDRCDDSDLPDATLCMKVVHAALGRTRDANQYWQLMTVLWYLHRLQSTRWFFSEAGG